ncbi:hypothetical protein CBOM_00753 [Ceraceosorus bombacis]|uniref:Uncharacterized protein n=1 Tax=Ceraceosorus bombacis TaxID=401625 RepID=A0A0P1B9Y2_9BASI|nr:hypothetical protein CBOM_00753 [Ceraceosorus bombacis]
MALSDACFASPLLRNKYGNEIFTSAAPNRVHFTRSSDRVLLHVFDRKEGGESGMFRMYNGDLSRDFSPRPIWPKIWNDVTTPGRYAIHGPGHKEGERIHWDHAQGQWVTTREEEAALLKKIASPRTH